MGWWDRLQGVGRPTTSRPLAPKPTSQDFTPGAVQRAVLRQTLQHPATILPGALAAVAALWSVVIDLSPASLLAMLGLGFVSAASWVVNYVGRGDTLAGQHVHRLRALRQAHESHEIDTLLLACQSSGFRAGAKEAEELTAAYQKLHQFLVQQQAAQPNPSGERFRVLAEDTYRHGVALLNRALHIFQALQQVDTVTLQQERQEWLRQREQAGTSENLERNIETHSRRLERYQRRAEELETLLSQLNELETALETAYLEVADLLGQAPQAGLFGGRAAAHLEIAVEAARRVEQRLQGWSDGDSQADAAYLDV